MKKLFSFIKAKDSDEKTTPSNKKSTNKEAKVMTAPEQNNDKPRELFGDDYSDIGYC